MRRLITLIAIGILVLPLAFTTDSHATRLGGKYNRSGTFTLYFSYGGAHRYYGNVWQGAANWSATSTPVNIASWPGTPYAIHIDVYDTYTSATWWGITYFNPCSGTGCNYARNYFYLNQRTMDPLNDFMRTKVATHEFGHTIGLAHAPSSATSVMKQGTLSYNTPRPYDVNDVNVIY